ncbi:MAG: ABC transporter permease [Acidobacteria bacterium]|nr:ABC transporter permease [Acidobacteriota bacterium]
MDTLLQDLKLVLRQLASRPAFAATAVLTLAIGMGVNAVAFTVINSVFLRGAGRVVGPDVGRILTTPGSEEGGNASLAEAERFTAATSGSLDLAAEGRLTMALRHGGAAETAWVLAVSPGYFSIVHAPVVAGRLSVEPVPGGAPSVVIGERFWRERLGEPSLTGLTLRLNNTDAQVAGVIAESFTGPAGLYSPDVWVPLEALPLFGAASTLQDREARWLFVLGRLAAGATVSQVQGQLDTAASLMARDWPDTHTGRGARFRLLSEAGTEVRSTAAAIVMGVIGLVLLLACFNVANLLLARAVERERDMGIRAALGAGPGRLVRLVITEGLVLAAMAGAGALAVAWWAQSLVGAFAIPVETPQHLDLKPDATVAGFIALLVIVAGVLPGLWPAVAAARIDVLRVLGSQGAGTAGGRRVPLRSWLVGAQIAGSTAFLVVAALFMQSYGFLSTADPDFARDELLVAEFDPAAQGYPADRVQRYAARLAERAGALPGAAGVAVADRAPFFVGFDRLMAAWPDGSGCEPGACPSYPSFAVGPGYFRTLGIAMAEGREFERADGPAEVVINGPLAETLWPGGRALGRTLRVGGKGAAATVVGVTARLRMRGFDREAPALFVPLSHDNFEGPLTIVVRTAMPTSLVRPFTEASQSVDASVPLLSVKTMAQRRAVQLWPFRTTTWVLSICGGLALLLGTAGLASVVIHAVSRRRREFGVRVSIGATPRDIVRDVLAGSIGLLLPGLLTGLMLSAAATRAVQAAFIGVNVLSPGVYLAVAVIEGAVVVLACLGPAWRASHVDALSALRSG